MWYYEDWSTKVLDGNVIGGMQLNRHVMPILAALLLIAGVQQAAAAPQPITLSPYAEAVSKIIKFDRRVLIIMKQESGGAIHRMVGYDEDNFQIIVDGVFVPVPDHRTDKVLQALRRKLSRMGYLPFVIEMNGSTRTDKIGVLKGTDQYEILRVMHTDGSHYNILNEDVIERLKEWERTAPFTIIGADNDWVEIEFKKLPGDLKAFTEEVYDFCPDAVDQGPGTAAGLAREIRQTRRLFLWWD
jgi:hypothetical protein